MRWNTPCLTHCWNRLWHVWYGGYRGGKSFQGAPVRKIHRMPLRTSRGSLAGLPLGSLDGVDDTMMGSIRFHCSLVSSILILLHICNLVSRFYFEMASNNRFVPACYDLAISRLFNNTDYAKGMGRISQVLTNRLILRYRCHLNNKKYIQQAIVLLR